MHSTYVDVLFTSLAVRQMPELLRDLILFSTIFFSMPDEYICLFLFFVILVTDNSGFDFKGT